MIAGVASPFLYSPFAKGWKRALLVPFILMVIWGSIRIVAIASYREPSPPLIGFVVVPFIVAISAAIVRGLKLLLFHVPFFRDMEQSIRSRIGDRRNHFKDEG